MTNIDRVTHFPTSSQPSERPRKSHVIKAQPSGVTVLQWSPDDSLLLCCGAEDCTEVVVYDTSNWTEKCRVSNSTEDSLTCCAWHHTGRRFYVGGLRGQFYECVSCYSSPSPPSLSSSLSSLPPSLSSSLSPSLLPPSLPLFLSFPFSF